MDVPAADKKQGGTPVPEELTQKITSYHLASNSPVRQREHDFISVE